MGGNRMKMREIIKALLDAMYDMGIDEETVAIAAESKNCHMHSSELLEVIRNAKSVLAEPIRNCEVGTAEEQFERWKEFCDKYDKNCTGCPCDGHICTLAYCFSKWSQMPYEKDRKGETDGS